MSGYCLCPLYPFDCDCEVANLECGIQIKRAPDSFKRFLYDRHFDANSLWDDPSKVDWVAYLPYPDKNIEHHALEKDKTGLTALSIIFQTDELVFDFVTALRLHKKGLVTPGPAVLAPSRNQEYDISFQPDWLHITIDDYSEEEPPKYEFRQSDIPEINKVLQDIHKWRDMEKSRSIEIALRRFHSAYRGNFEARLIDQMIAFEALYLEEDQELSYRLALRTAFLLEKDPEQRKHIFDIMKAAYKLRSKIVHGNEKPIEKELKNTIPITEDYLRQSIRKFLSFLSGGYSLEAIRKDLLDENILNNSILL